jgi:hypothetical protein
LDLRFQKRVVVTTDEQYPQHISVQFVQDKCDLLNSFQVGEAVKIDINLRGREWTNAQEKPFISILFKVGELQNYKRSSCRTSTTYASCSSISPIQILMRMSQTICHSKNK